MLAIVASGRDRVGPDTPTALPAASRALVELGGKFSTKSVRFPCLFFAALSYISRARAATGAGPQVATVATSNGVQLCTAHS